MLRAEVIIDYRPNGQPTPKLHFRIDNNYSFRQTWLWNHLTFFPKCRQEFIYYRRRRLLRIGWDGMKVKLLLGLSPVPEALGSKI